MIHAKKEYVEGGFYHIYNRGVNREPVFVDNWDYQTFICLLEKYLAPKNGIFHDEITLLAFCLMENHFHLLVQQHKQKSIAKFMHALEISFIARINKKYKRVGHLFQGVYKARKISNEVDNILTSRYIHINPEINNKKKLLEYPFSSLKSYVRYPDNQHTFLNIGLIMRNFDYSPKLYEDFVLSSEYKKIF